MCEKSLLENIENGNIKLLLNIPSNKFNNNSNTFGFKMRRKCIDYNIHVLTNIKCIKLFISSLKRYVNNDIIFKC